MARGKPAVWSTILGLPFIVAGVYVYVGGLEVPPLVGLPFAVFGGFIVVMGFYIHFVAAPESPTMRDDEHIVDKRHPTQRVALVKICLGLPLLAATVYLMFFSQVPYVYPTVTLLVGLYFFSKGLEVYWSNSLTTYYLTNRRMIREYRLISLIRQELPLDKVRGVEERKSVTEALVGLGNVKVASGGGGGSLKIVMRNMEQSTKFADQIREYV
ncbi:PH domain-containing protein [Halobaculum marinum]|uniref:PH domain-containing protein n=1 Tax=Halobaculum marinum TaxID=3031996 RepID=A0ABD5WY33_9EURY|nr:PH domain-containing protein [Halobaculum sp. DT55]